MAATSNPYHEYLEQALAAQQMARDRINGYLALSIVDAPLRLLGRIQPRNRKANDEGSAARDAPSTHRTPN